MRKTPVISWGLAAYGPGAGRVNSNLRSIRGSPGGGGVNSFVKPLDFFGLIGRILLMNMSYCRFENTLNDLEDCVESLDNGKELSESEQACKERLIELCKDIAENYGE